MPTQSAMTVETSRFGRISVSAEDILLFPEGMLGFSKINEYVLIEGAEDSLFLWLQALNKPTVAFPLLEPQIFDLNYKIEVEDEDKKLLGIKSLKDTRVFCIVTIPSDPTKMTANLKAPIVINWTNRKSKQVILHSLDYPIRRAIFADLQRHCATTSARIFPEGEGAATKYQIIRISDNLPLERSA